MLLIPISFAAITAGTVTATTLTSTTTNAGTLSFGAGTYTGHLLGVSLGLSGNLQVNGSLTDGAGVSYVKADGSNPFTGNISIGSGTASNTFNIAFNENRASFGYDGVAQSAIVNAGAGKNINLDVNNNNVVNITSSGQVQIRNSVGNHSTRLKLMNDKNNNETYNQFNKVVLSFITGQSEALSIVTHEQLITNHPNHVSFYSDLTNGSDNNKAIQWNYGINNNVTGILQMIRLNRLEFPENWTGYYLNQTNSFAGIDSKDSTFYIDVDSNNNNPTDRFYVTNNNRTNNFIFLSDQNENNAIKYSGSRAVTGYDGSNAYLQGGSAKGASIKVNGGTVVATAKTTGSFNLNPLVSAPTSPALGDMYTDTSNALCWYNSTAWEKIGGSGTCS